MTNELSQRFSSLFKSIQRSGSFAFGEPFNPACPLPGLDIGTKIGFPLTNPQAEQIIQKCSRAPFGRGSQSVIDITVRNTWQLDPSEFRLTNPCWDDVIQEMVENVGTGLGLPKSSVAFELYKLLLYEKGSFFHPHRDTEKVDRMFGTMVVLLPSNYEGGELVVRHDGKEKMFDFAKGSEFNVHYLAFYADCQHEIKEIRSGFRLCLVYNLFHRDSGVSLWIQPR